MLDTVFYFILNMSIAACFAVAVLLLVRLIKPLPKRILYPLWSLAFLRLVLPFTLSTKWSLFKFTGDLVKRLVMVETVTGVSLPDKATVSNFIGAAESYAPVEYKTEVLRSVFATGAIIWAIVAAAALLTAAALYLLTRRELNKAVRIRDTLYRSDMLISPVLIGVFKPRIILPPGLDPDSNEGRMVLAHENVHRRRRDNLWRVLAVCVTCLHWFNPLAWVALKVFMSDMERSCDEAVVKDYAADERKAYAHTLLRFAEDKRVLVSSAFGRSGVKVRIAGILAYKTLTVFGAVVSAVFILAVAVVLLTNPQLRG